MDELNPYAPPAEGEAPGAERDGEVTGVRHDGEYLAVNRYGASLPDRCVVCNAPANGYRLKKTFTWHPPGIYVLVCVGLLIYAIAAMLVRKTGIVKLGLCASHRERRQNGLILAWAGFGVSFVLMIACSMNDLSGLTVVFMLLMLVLPLAGLYMARVGVVTRMDDQSMWLKVGRPFLDSFDPSSDFEEYEAVAPRKRRRGARRDRPSAIDE